MAGRDHDRVILPVMGLVARDIVETKSSMLF